MIGGTFTGGAASALVLAADDNRDVLTFQLTNAVTLYFGFGTAAVAGSSLHLLAGGDSLTVRGHLARQAVYVLGNTATCCYQEGDLSLDV